MGTPTTATASSNRSKYSRLSSAAVPLPSGEALFRKAKPCVHPRRKRKTFTQTDIHTKSDA